MLTWIKGLLLGEKHWLSIVYLLASAALLWILILLIREIKLELRHQRRKTFTASFTKNNRSNDTRDIF